MAEQNNQNFENQEPNEEVKETKSNVKKLIPQMAIIIGAIAVVVIAIALMLIVLPSGNNDTSNLCEHTYVETVSKEPTCEEHFGNGDKLFTCSKCGYYYTEYDSIPALEHNYIESVHKEPTCGTNGQGDIKFTCTQCGHVYIKYDSIPALEHKWIDATCTTQKKCSLCGKIEGFSLGHDFTETTDGTCVKCGAGVKFILPSTPVTIYCYNLGWDKACKIESIKIERKGDGYPYYHYQLTFIVQSTYHEKGNNYSDGAYFGWKLYDEDGFVVDSGTGHTSGGIKVGEKSKGTITFYIGADKDVQNGKTYRLELHNIS